MIGGEGVVGGEVEIGDEGSDEEVRAGAWTDEVAVFADPAETAADCPGALEDGGTIYKAATVDVADLGAEVVK